MIMNTLKRILLTIFAVFLLSHTVHAAQKTVYMIHWMKSGRTVLGDTFIQYMKDKRLNVKFVERFADQDINKLREFVQEAKRTKPDLIYVYSTTGVLETVGPWDAKDKSQYITDIPVVATAHSAPVGSRVVKEINKPTGRNMTGVSHHIPHSITINIMKSFKPDAKRIATLSNSHEANSKASVKAFVEAEKEYGFITTTFFYKTDKNKKLVMESLDDTIVALLKTKPDIIFLPSDGLNEANIEKVIQTFIAHKDIHAAPLYTTLESMIIRPRSCTFGLIASFYVMGLMAAVKAENILFNGMKVETIPYEIGNQMSLVMKADTMNALKTYPTLSFIESAEIINDKE